MLSEYSFQKPIWNKTTLWSPLAYMHNLQSPALIVRFMVSNHFCVATLSYPQIDKNFAEVLVSQTIRNFLFSKGYEMPETT